MIAANVNALWPNQIKEGSLFLVIRVSFTYHHKGNDGINLNAPPLTAQEVGRLAWRSLRYQTYLRKEVP